MDNRIKAALQDPSIKEQALKDFSFTFEKLGLDSEKSKDLSIEVINRLLENTDLVQTEKDIYQLFSTIIVNDMPLTKILDMKMSGRAKIILEQITPYFNDIPKNAKIIDFGCGDGQVTQLLQDTFGFTDIVGYEIKSYPSPHVKAPIKMFDGFKTQEDKKTFDVCLLTNVAHHESENQKMLEEIGRIMKPNSKLVVIETVPIENTHKAFEINFLNDYFYNRLFHQADIPVPGSYELTENWPHRFASVGFTLEDTVILGYDQPTIKDWHVLYTFIKNN